MTSTKSRYIVDVKTARSGALRYGRPRVIRVLDTHAGPTEWYWVRRGVVAQWGTQVGRGHRLDARYNGPKSAFGLAHAAATTLADILNYGVDVTARAR